MAFSCAAIATPVIIPPASIPPRTSPDLPPVYHNLIRTIAVARSAEDTVAAVLPAAN